MGTVRKTEKAKYKVRYRDPTGKQRYKTFDKKGDATDFLTRVEVEVRGGGWVDPKRGRILFQDWVEQWWPTTLDLRPSTRDRDRQYIETYLLPFFGEVPLAKIAPLEVRKFVGVLDAEGLAPATTRKAYQILSKILRSATEAELISLSPCKGVSLPKIEIKEMRFLTTAEIRRLADTIDPRHRALVLVAAYGGLRWAELVGLRLHRVDLDEGIVNVVETLVESHGRLLPPGPPKTKAGRRKVRLPESVAAELERHIELHCDPSSDLVFQNTLGGPLRRSAFRSRVWLPTLLEAQVEPLRFHDLRHTAVAFWIAARAHVKEIARRAGHTSAAVVLDRYGHIFPEDEKRLCDQLEEMFQNAGTLSSKPKGDASLR